MPQSLSEKLRLNVLQPLTILNRPDTIYFSEYIVSEIYPQSAVDIIILFVKDLEDLKNQVLRIIFDNILNPNGRLLVAYPKKGNKVFDSYVHRDDIFPALEVNDEGYVKGSDYKFNQMVKLDETYTIIGMKKVEKRTTKKAVSQCVIDYDEYIPAIQKELETDTEALLFFQNLTSGYKRNWARYIYSAKQAATQEKRKVEMLELLKKGIKSKELA